MALVAWTAPGVVWADHHEEKPASADEAKDDVKKDTSDEAKSNEAAEEEEDKGPFEDFDEVTEDTELHEGFFDVYIKPGAMLMAIEPDQLGVDFLMNFEIAQGVGSRGLNGGTMLNVFEGALVALEQHGHKIYLVQKPIRYRASGGDAWDEVMNLSFGNSVLAVADIKTVREDDEAVLIDVMDWFVSDLSDVGTFVKFAVSDTPGKPGGASLDDKRSYLESVKVFPENLSIRSKLTFKLNEPPPFGSIADWRYLPLTVHTTLAALPEEPMEPRLADDRMGYFLTVHKDFSRTEDTFFTRYVNRWRLEKGKKRGELYEPKQPIVYYLDRTIPKEYRKAVKQGIEAWNKAFEAAGFKNAIQAKDLPDDADAEDIRYATVRWMATDQPSYLAIGPSVVDPRTGEILDADVLVDALFALRVSRDWQDLVDPATAVNQLFADPVKIPGTDPYRCEHVGFTTQLGIEASLMHATLVDRGAIRPGDPMPKEYVEQFLRWVVMHEVGHTLGLRHNFRSSTDTPMSKLHDAKWTEANGLVSSVMDYAAANVAGKDQPNGQYFATTVGTSDEWVISYGYHYDADEAAKIARLGASPGHAYGSDEDRSGAGALDPTVNAWDLGADPLAWSQQRTAIIEDLWPNLPQNVLADNSPRMDLTVALQYLLASYATSLSPAIKYVGGQYVYRDHNGDPNARDPFVPVERALQKKALDHIVAGCFAADAMALPTTVLDEVGPNRWTHWGSNITFNGRIDYPYHEQVLGVQKAFLNQLTHPMRLARMVDAETKFGADRVLTLPELMDELTQAVWSEVYSASTAPIPSTRRNLQRAYVDRMTTLLTHPPDRTPPDARSVTRWQLQKLKDRIEDRLASMGDAADVYTQAHLAEVDERIGMALDAGLEVEMLSN
jgi:hypothetical protein